MAKNLEITKLELLYPDDGTFQADLVVRAAALNGRYTVGVNWYNAVIRPTAPELGTCTIEVQKDGTARLRIPPGLFDSLAMDGAGTENGNTPKPIRTFWDEAMTFIPEVTSILRQYPALAEEWRKKEAKMLEELKAFVVSAM